MSEGGGVIYAKDKPLEDENRPILLANGQLSFIGADCQSIHLLAQGVNGNLVRRLDLSFNLLTNLDGLERFPNLEELILDNNQLGDDIVFPPLHRLHTLMINKNNILTLSSFLDKLTQLPRLTYLSLLGNEACPNQLSDLDKGERDYQRYRHFVLYRLPDLKFIDASPVKEDERKEGRRIKAMEVVRPKDSGPGISMDADEITQPPNLYTPLPDNPGAHSNRATFGKCKYVYYGRHSEGNRFIRNNDL